MRCILLFENESSSLVALAAGKAVAAYSAYLATAQTPLAFYSGCWLSAPRHG